MCYCGSLFLRFFTVICEVTCLIFMLKMRSVQIVDRCVAVSVEVVVVVNGNNMSDDVEM